MAAQQQQQQSAATPVTPLPHHAWSGAYKTINDLLDERDAWQDSLSTNEIKQRLRGKHFSHMEDVWGTQPCHVMPQDFSTIKRTKNQGALYQSCYKHIQEEMRDPDWTSTSSTSTANEQGNFERIDPVGNHNGQSAYLLSHSKVCHRAYPFLAEAAVGTTVQDMGLYGNTPAHQRRKLLVGVKDHHCTSLKDHKFNKMYWKYQKENFDSDDPCVLVVPLLPFDQIKNWSIDAEHALDYDVAVFTFGPKKRIVAGETLLYAKGTCSAREVAQARENLTHFVKGIAAHLVSENVFESLPKQFFIAKNSSLVRWGKLVQHLRGMEDPQVLIPTSLAGSTDVRIAKARMSAGTSLPDPWLLLAKSAINYSAANGQQLMPACPSLEESDSEDDDDTSNVHEDNGEDEEMSSSRTEYYLGALHRVGFGGEVPMETK